MKQPILKSIIDQLIATLPETAWKGRSLAEIEAETQQLVQQLGTLLLEQHLLPARLQEIEDSVQSGQTRCDHCQGPYQVHKQRQALTASAMKQWPIES
jgi:hypothetical protein